MSDSQRPIEHPRTGGSEQLRQRCRKDTHEPRSRHPTSRGSVTPNRQWAEKVAGKLRCHRPRSGPYRVLARYLAEIKPLSVPPDSVPDNPPKPHPDFPLRAHASGRVGEGDLREGPLLRQMGRSPGGLIDVCIANDHPTRTGSFGPGLPVEAVRSLAMHGSIEEHVAVKDVLLAGKTPLHGDRLALRNLVARASLGGPDFEGPVDVGRSLAVRTSGRRPIGSTPDFVRGGRGQ